MKLQNNGNGGSDVSSTNSTVAADGIKALSSLASVADIHQPATNNSDNSTGGLNSVQLSQLMVAPGDDNGDPTLFPTGSLDVNRQQVDLRKHNSWTMKLDEVSTPELAEVFAINTMAPTILNARLKGMMQRNPDDLKFIVNVSAMEGKFYRFKSERHPHTNMAKAALNMLTRTSAQDYIKSNIHMTSVDTGWINDEKPIDLAVKHEKKHKFQTPLDEIDAAARVLDPVIGPLNALDRGEVADPPWGVFLKDYMKCEW
jgi:NAD(P)-dependent dehydrogenase (short-subunit alcohol dehydrogenase family)